MRTVKALFFKESGKYYTDEDIEVPENLTHVYKVVDWICDNYHKYPHLHMFMLMNEFPNGYPVMIPKDSRKPESTE